MEQILPEKLRNYTLANNTLLCFAKNVNDEDALIVRNKTTRRTVIVPMSRFGEFNAFPEEIPRSILQYAQHLFSGRLTKGEAVRLADIVLDNYDLVFNHKPELEESIARMIERDRLVVTLDGEKIIDAG